MTDIIAYLLVYGTVMYFITKLSLKIFRLPSYKAKLFAILLFSSWALICYTCIDKEEADKREMREFMWKVEHQPYKPISTTDSKKNSTSSGTFSGNHSSHSGASKSSDYYDFDDFYDDTWGDYEDEDEAYEEWDRLYN